MYELLCVNMYSLSPQGLHGLWVTGGALLNVDKLKISSSVYRARLRQ